MDATAASPLLGTVLAERYRVDKLLAEGAMGQVFLGEHVMMKKQVAIKVLKRSLTRVPEVVARFEREARAAANIDHPNVVAATDFGKTGDDSVFLVLEYIEGTSLRDVLGKGPLPLGRALNVGRQIAAALSAAHALNIVHRDLKPENVMLLQRGSEEDFAKVLDFGIAKIADTGDDEDAEEDAHSITNPGMVFGTPEYMPPEQGLGQEVDARADIYSLGVIVFELIAGKLPFDVEQGILGQQLKGQVPKIGDRNPKVRVPAAVDAFLSAMLASDVADRVQSAKEALRSFDALIADHADAGAGSDSSAAERTGRSLQDSVADLNVRAEAVVGRLPKSLRSLPPAVLIGAPAGLLALLVGLLFVGGKSREPVTASHAMSPVAPSAAPQAPVKLLADEAELSVAKAAGLTVLSELAAKYPKDPKVLVGYARMLSKEQQHTKAVEEVQKALDLAPEMKSEWQLATVLFAGAQSKASQPTFDLLTGKMGAFGADIMYDLATVQGVRGVTQKLAQKHLEGRPFAQAATPEASVAAELFVARTCESRKALLKRAEHVGDYRSLEQLKRFSGGHGCAEGEPQPCNQCLIGSPELTAAVGVLETRSKTKK